MLTWEWAFELTAGDRDACPLSKGPWRANDFGPWAGANRQSKFLVVGHATSQRKIEMKKNHRGINLASRPSGDGCVECLASPKGWWFHLRRCAECGHIGCCDSSPSQHATKHAAATGHPIIASFEPGEDWFFDYEKQGMIEGVELLPPHSHPKNQPAPGPAGRVPANWESLLN
jgi:hypothetical protein